MDILTMLTKQLGDPKALEQLGKSAGARPDQVEQLTKTALPTLLKTLQQNASSPDGAKSLDKAIDEHKDDKVDDIFGFLQNVDTKDGEKMLQHIFSGKKGAVESELAKKTGLNNSQVSTMLTQLAPLVLGTLGNQKKQGKQLDLGGLLGSAISSFFKR